MSRKDLVSINPNELKDFLNHIISNNRHLQENGKEKYVLVQWQEYMNT